MPTPHERRFGDADCTAAQLPTSRSWPGDIPASVCRMLPTSGRRWSMRFDGARMISMRRPRPFRFCWCGRPRSMLNRASKYSPACRSNAPFFVPDQPSACTLLTWCPVNSAARARGRFSSSRTRTGQNEIARQVQRSECLFLGHRRKLIQEMVESLSAFQVVEERPNRHPRAAKNGRASGDFRVAVDDGLRFSPHPLDDNPAPRPTRQLHRRGSGLVGRRAGWCSGLRREPTASSARRTSGRF